MILLILDSKGGENKNSKKIQPKIKKGWAPTIRQKRKQKTKTK